MKNEPAPVEGLTSDVLTQAFNQLDIAFSLLNSDTPGWHEADLEPLKKQLIDTRHRLDDCMVALVELQANCEFARRKKP